jgi:hypothetical protein
MKLSVRFEVKGPSLRYPWFHRYKCGQLNTAMMTPTLALLAAQACRNTADELGLETHYK